MCDAYNLPSESEATYHGDDVCDRLQYNAYKSSLDRRKCSGRLDVTSCCVMRRKMISSQLIEDPHQSILTVGACSAVGIQHAGGNRQSRIRNDAPTKVDESRRCVTYSQKAYTMDGPGREKQQTHSGLTRLSQR